MQNRMTVNFMRRTLYLKQFCPVLVLGVCAFVLQTRAEVTTNSPTEWIDPDTGHRVIQLSREPGSQSLYFNLNAFTPDGQKMVVSTPTGISTINLNTRTIEKIVDGRARIIMVGHKTGQVYYSRNGVVYATDLDTKATREIAKLPPGGSVSTVNADETLLAGTITGPDSSATNEENVDFGPNRLMTEPPRSKARNIEARFDEHLPMELFFSISRPVKSRNTAAATTGSIISCFRPPTPICSCSATKARGTRWTASGPSAPTART